MNISSFLDVNAKRYPKKVAVVDLAKNKSITYEGLLEYVKSSAALLKKRGVKKGDRVCIYFDSSLDFLISYFSIWGIGGVVVPTNIEFKADELKYLIEDSEAKFLISEKKSIKNAATDLDAEVNVIEPDELGEGTGLKIDAENCDFNDICQLQYTSGTTGKPKGAMLTHGNWIAAMENEREVLNLSPEDIYLGFYPMNHVGVSWGISTIRYGGTFVIMRRYKLEDFLKYAMDFRATILSSMPPVTHALVEAQEGAEEYLRNTKLVISGGGPLPPNIWERFDKRYHIPIANAYGLSETIVVGTGASTTPGSSMGYESVGLPVGFSEIKTVDEDGKELPAYEVGEIALRGPGVAKGYWKRSDNAFRSDGWFLTGDLGFIDERGFLYVVDRKKDVIIMSGWKIYPKEVEEVLLKYRAIKEAAVFARADELRGEVPVAAVVLKEKASKEEIMSYCKEKLAGYKVPRDIVFLDELPRINGWKLVRKELEGRYGNGLMGSNKIR